MIRFKSQLTGCAVVAALALAGFYLSPANGAVADVNQPHPATGVGSCTLKNPHPKPSAHDLKERIQTYRPDNYDCDGSPPAAALPKVAKRRHFGFGGECPLSCHTYEHICDAPARGA